MSDTATTERANKVTVSDLGPSRKKLAIEIPAETVTEHLAESMNALAANADVPGFRRGRVPRNIVEKKYGNAVRQEAKGKLISAAYTAAVEEHKLQVLGDPFGGDVATVEVHEGKPLAFEVEIEVVPQFELPTLSGFSVKRPVLEISDEMVENEIRKIVINEGSLESRETPEAGDYLTGHGVMIGGDGTKFYDLQGAVIQVPTADKNGRGMILGVMVEDFAKQLGLPKPGETVTIKTKGPENHEVEGIRNADLTITFKVDRVDRIIPAKEEDVAKQFGLPGPAEMREAVRARLQQQVAIRQSVAMRQQIARALLEKVNFELPPRMTSRQAGQIMERQRMELMYRGVDPMQIEEHVAELRAASGARAATDLKLFFILHRAAETLGVTIDEGEINGRIAQMAMERNMRPDRLRQELIQQNRIGVLVQQVREHKALDAILSLAEVTDISAEEWDAQNKAAAAAEKKA